MWAWLVEGGDREVPRLLSFGWVVACKFGLAGGHEAMMWPRGGWFFVPGVFRRALEGALRLRCGQRDISGAKKG